MVGRTGVKSVCAIWWEKYKYQKLYTVLSSLGVVFLMCIFVNCICPACILVILCVFALSYVYLLFLICICCTLCVFVVLCVYCCSYFRCRTAGQKSVSGRSCDRPPRHRVFLVSLCLQANAEMVPEFPSCYYMLLMQPSRLKFPSYFFFFHICVHVK